MNDTMSDCPRFIPDTTYVRNMYMLQVLSTPTFKQEEAYAEFDVWLRNHDEQVWNQGWEHATWWYKGLKEITPENPYVLDSNNEEKENE